jgi:hypothetical protein
MMSGDLICRENSLELGLGLEGNNFSLPKSKLAREGNHIGKQLEEKPGRVGPAGAGSLAADHKHSPAKLPLGWLFNKDRNAIGNRLTHECGLSTGGGFGTEQSAEKPTLIKRLFRCRKLGSSQVNAL